MHKSQVYIFISVSHNVLLVVYFKVGVESFVLILKQDLFMRK